MRPLSTWHPVGSLTNIRFVSEMKQGFENERQLWFGRAIVTSELCFLEKWDHRAGNFCFEVLQTAFQADVQVLDFKVLVTKNYCYLSELFQFPSYFKVHTFLLSVLEKSWKNHRLESS